MVSKDESLDLNAKLKILGFFKVIRDQNKKEIWTHFLNTVSYFEEKEKYA
jgi:hypothetical protein